MSGLPRYFARAVAVGLACLAFWGCLLAARVGDRDTVVRTPRSGSTATDTPTVRPVDGWSAADTGALPWPARGQAALAVAGTGSLGSSGTNGPVPIASVAKMMTAYLVLRAHPLDGPGFTVTVSARDVADERERAANDESVVPVEVGEVLDERQLLQGLLLPSGNNIAILLAVHESRSVAEFVTRMNAAARELGMDESTYTDPSGLDAGTVSTAGDQLILLREAMRNRDFAHLVTQRSARLPVAGTVHNTNPLLGDGGFVGAKTGSDDAAGGCLAFVAVRNVGGRVVRLFGVVLGQRGPRLIGAAARAARVLADGAFARLG